MWGPGFSHAPTASKLRSHLAVCVRLCTLQSQLVEELKSNDWRRLEDEIELLRAQARLTCL
jgi:hypothetical protein